MICRTIAALWLALSRESKSVDLKSVSSTLEWSSASAGLPHAPAIVDDREGDARLLNGPKLDGEDGHASQNDIDALFD